MTTFRVMSDLHLEGLRGQTLAKQAWAQYQGEDALILAGDINVGVENVANTIKQFFDLGFPQIFYVMGNHECYHGELSDMRLFNPTLKLLVDNDRLHILDADRVIRINDISVFGATLWTNFWHDPIAEIDASSFISDFRMIRGFNTTQCYLLNQDHVSYLKQTYEMVKGKKLIVTHFLPAYEAVSDRWKGQGKVESSLNKYFANRLDDWIEQLENTTWVFGHTHDHVDKMLGQTRLVANPKGYGNEQIPEHLKFNPFMTIEL